MAEDNVPPPTSDHEDMFVGKLDIPKLRDAKLAGSDNYESCTLILTEGVSASKFAMSGDIYGVFPLEGKLLNVRDASPQELEQNAQIQNIKKILGLQYHKIYEDVDKLRYGHLMIMANKGHDSLHIIGLLINFLHYFWPSLLKVKKNFLRVLITPIIKATEKKTNKVVSLFYTLNEDQTWQKRLGNEVTEYKIEYFEVPGTITSEERAKYLDQHIKDFVWIDDHDGRAIELAFTKESDVRQLWLGSQQGDMTRISLQTEETKTHLDSVIKEIRYFDFINLDFKQYVEADLQRSIPSIMDGLKPGQRKILFYALKKPIIQKIGVAEFCAYMFDHSPYHHGEESLVGTIIGMAQNYVGSNNINILQPNGQFGTRLMGGKDHDASGICLFTQLSPITRYLFPEDDDDLFLLNLNDDNVPAWFIPIIPMVLVNGSEGRGTVCSSFIPNYHPRDIISNLKRLLNGEKMEPMLPWYNGFKGEIEERETPKFTFYTTKGKIEDDKNGITITELPVGKWTYVYHEFLEKASRGEDIKAYTARHGHPNNVRFEVTMTEDQKIIAKEEGFLNKFKLTTTLSTDNMHLLLYRDNLLMKYNTPEQILEYFFNVRLQIYEERKYFWIPKLEKASMLLQNKVKFIGDVCNGEILMFPSKGKDKMCAELKEKGFPSSQSIEGRRVTEEEELRTGYDYLLSTPLASFSYEKLEELKKELVEKKSKLSELKSSSPKDLWLKDLDALIRKLDAEEYPSAEKRAPAKRAQRANKKGRTRRVVCSEASTSKTSTKGEQERANKKSCM